MGGVVEIVVPLGGVAEWPAVPPVEMVGNVPIVLGRQMHGAVRDADADLPGQFGEEVGGGGIPDLIHRVEAEAVHAVLLEPAERVLDEEAADGGARVVDPGAPGRVARGVEERLGIGVEIVPLGSEVIVDDVEEDHETTRMRGVDERAQVVGRPVDGVRRVGKDAVIAPAPVAREMRDGHDLDRREARLGQRVQPVDGGAEGPVSREGPDMQLADDRLLPGAPAPVCRPGILRAGDERRAVHVPFLPAGGRVGDHASVRKHEGVGRLFGGVECRLEPALARGPHRQVGAVQAQPERRVVGRPEAEPHAAVRQTHRAPGGKRALSHGSASRAGEGTAPAGRRDRPRRSRRGMERQTPPPCRRAATSPGPARPAGGRRGPRGRRS